MDLWLKIGSAMLLGMMILVLLPQARHMLRESTAARPGDWRAAVLPVMLVAGFILLLMWLV